MNDKESVSRRSFLAHASGAFSSGWLSAQWPIFLATATAACSRRDSGDGFVHLDDNLAYTLDAVAEQIIPADGSPGAREAGVIWFIDELLGRWPNMKGGLEVGAQDLDGRSASGRFADLPFDVQTELITEIEAGSFFSTMRFLTLAGMFAMPSRGGNRDKAGWKLIGFRDQHDWQPPFGYYDEMLDEEADSEGGV